MFFLLKGLLKDTQRRSLFDRVQREEVHLLLKCRSNLCLAANKKPFKLNGEPTVNDSKTSEILFQVASHSPTSS